ncbi:MAG TPA: DUF5667 domain-containing protein [Candidatus Paceibacterota bacterium]|nr:DUF5667 domain-containing protein [Candidatus Paceibacterota bacterium]
MNEFFTTLAKEGKKGGLTASEKSAMFARLEAHMKAHPRVKAPSPYLTQSPYAFLLSRTVLVPFLFMLLVIGGASAYAAEGALPGDLLYPIKVSVTEPVREVLAFSAEAKAAWHAEAVGRRLREAETLALRGELSAARSAEIEAEFDRHISMVETFLGAVESNSPLKAAEISARFAGSLAAYGSDLLRAGLKSVDIASRKETDSLAEHVKTKKAELVSPERAKAANPARTKFKPSSSRPSSPAEATVPAEVTLSARAAISQIESLNELKQEVASALSRVELQYDDLRPRLGTDASREIEMRVADVRDLLSAVDDSDEKKKAASLERIRLALKHAAGLEAFLKEHKKDMTASSTPSNFGAEPPKSEKPPVEVAPPAVVPVPSVPVPSPSF